MALAPIPENFRSEMARHMLTRADVGTLIGMNANMLSGYLTGKRPLTGWAAHNIGVGINLISGVRLIDVDMNKGVVKAKPGRRKAYGYPHGILSRAADRRRAHY